MSARPRVLVCDDEPHIVRALEAGADDYVTKPFSPRVLRTLARNRGRLLTHRALLQEVWGPAYGDDVPTLRTSIARLRRKIEPEDGPRFIRTDAGVGTDSTPSGGAGGRSAAARSRSSRRSACCRSGRRG